MVVKKCPDCDQTLPVACKSCPCGHVFISKKQLNITQQDKADAGDSNHRDQRLRPEVPKLVNNDFDYNFGAKMEKSQEPESSIMHERLIPKRLSESPLPEIHQMVQVVRTNHTTIIGTAPNQPMIPESSSLRIADGYNISKRKRGRPKGSKNKPKPLLPPGEELHSSAHDDSNGQNTESGDPSKPKRGRPKGSKNKPKDPSLLKGKSANLNHHKDEYSSDQLEDYYQEPYRDTMMHVSKEKAISYSIVLSDINQKMMKQSSMNFI